MAEVETAPSPSNPAVVEAARSLALHLREQPRDRVAPPARLAEQFGMPQGLVCSVLEGVRQANQRKKRKSLQWREQLSAGLTSVNNGLRDLTNDPLRFLFFSSIALALAGWPPFALLVHQHGWLRLTSGIALVLEFVAYTTLQTVCVWRAGKSRFAWLAAALTWTSIVFVGFLGNVDWRKVFGPGGIEVFSVLVVAFVVGFILAFMQGLALTLVAVVGNYVRLAQIDRHTSRLTRQEAIQRLMELQTRLTVAAPESKASSGFRRLRTRFRQHAQGLCLGAGLAFGVAALLLPGQMETIDGYGLLVSLCIGILSPGPVTAFLFGAAFGLAEFGPPWLRLHSFATLGSLLLSTFGRGIWASAVGFISFLYEMNSREARLARNEVNALVEELIRVEWRLQEAASWITAISIDAAGSTRMKVGADPLMVEYSFRAYQHWIARTCYEHAGTVTATAGDGAIVSFRDAAHALTAAKKLQRDLALFNELENRIGVPFRIRIGIHRGQIRGALHEVEFTNVIDIAAHIEKISPVGGIGISESAFQESLLTHQNEMALALAEPVDGQTVYVIVNATGEL